MALEKTCIGLGNKLYETFWEASFRLSSASQMQYFWLEAGFSKIESNLLINTFTFTG